MFRGIVRGASLLDLLMNVNSLAPKFGNQKWDFSIMILDGGIGFQIILELHLTYLLIYIGLISRTN